MQKQGFSLGGFTGNDYICSVKIKKGVHHEDIYHHIAYLDGLLDIRLSPSPTQERKEKVFQGSKGIEGKKGKEKK